MTAPADPIVLPDIQLIEDTEAQLDPPSKVIIHNDDFTPMEFVIHVLRAVFKMSWFRADAIMLTAHHQGQALVGVYPREEAKYKVGQAHGMARAENWPLTFTIEPAEQ